MKHQPNGAIAPFLRRLDRAGVWIEHLSTALAASGFAVVVGAFIWTVFCRYVLHDPSTKSEEIAIVVYLWVVTVGASLAIKLDEHIAFDLLTSLLPTRPAALIAGTGALIAAAVLLIALPYTLDYIAFLWREKTTVLRLPLNWLYFCFGIMQAALGVKLLLEALRQAAILFAPQEKATS
jgi:TRAP-type transport system small permease protein